MGQARVLGVLAGEDMALDLLRRWAESADVLLAADGGADRLRSLGIVPHATIGDLDSISAEARQAQDELILDPDQDTSDCDKLLSLAHRLGHSQITIASLEGDLIDHTLGTLSSAIASPLGVMLALRRGLGWILKGETSKTVRCPVGSRVSLMPLSEVDGATMSGVEWPIMERRLGMGDMTSLSNRSFDNQIMVRQRSGASLLFVGFPDEELPIWPEGIVGS